MNAASVIYMRVSRNTADQTEPEKQGETVLPPNISVLNVNNSLAHMWQDL